MTTPVGLVSRKRAEYLMRAAAMSGGAVYVGLLLNNHTCLESLDGRGGWGPLMYLAVGTLPNGEAVPTRLLKPEAVLTALRAEVDRLEQIGKVSSCLEELRDEVAVVLADLESKLAT